jgi:hypothetical protein
MYPQMTLSAPGVNTIPDQGTSVVKHKVVRREHTVDGAESECGSRDEPPCSANGRE